MHILLESRPFYPSVGGMETVARQLAEAWHSQGHTVSVVTQTPLDDAEPLDALDVIRQPAVATWWHLLQDADIFVQSGISLKSLPLGLLSGTPVVFIHHTFQHLQFNSIGVRSGIKRLMALTGQNIAVSSAVAKSLTPAEAEIIPNPVKLSFTSVHIEDKNPECLKLLFVGRLFSEKGADVAIRALKELLSRDLVASLYICGDGPERGALEKLVVDLNVESNISFEGWVSSEEVRAYMEEAHIQAIPSRSETFGVVALESIAAGCAVVASDTGGLPEAVGPCGILVPPNNPAALAQGIEKAVSTREELLASCDEHLARFDIDVIAGQYLEVFRRVVG